MQGVCGNPDLPSPRCNHLYEGRTLPYGIHPIGTRERLRQTFDGVAQLYDENRPSYPPQVFDDVVAISGASAESSLLEIGCGTGHATREFAARGLRIDGIELGENMAAIARRRLQPFPRVTVQIADFDHWTTTERYDLVYAATAYHWLDPAHREQKIAALLRPSGWLAIWRNCHVRNGSRDDFLDAAQAIYFRIAPELAMERGRLPVPSEAVDAEKEAFTSNLFEEPQVRVHLWRKAYSAEEYVDLANTHSDHQLLPADRRKPLFDALATLIETQCGGSVVKDYATVLQMARVRS
jgi:trans-aconitate methyltransferase